MSDQSIVTPPPPYYQPVPPQQPRPNSGLAIASLVLGLVGLFLSWFTFGIPSLLALIFGIVAIRQTGAGWGKRGGRGMAVAGTVLGAVITVAGLLVSLLVIYSVGHAANEIGKSVDATASAAATTAPSASEPDTSAPEVTTAAPAQAPAVLAVDQTLSISQSSNGTEEGTADITVTKIATANREPVDYGSKPDHGWYVVVSVKAVATSGSLDINTFNFYLRSSNGFHTEDATYSDAWGAPLESATLHAGEHSSGTIVFDAPTRHGQIMFGDYGGDVIGYWKF
jgi:hypothetical protein